MSLRAAGEPREFRGRDQHLALAVANEIARYRGGGHVSVVSVPEEEDRTSPTVELETADAAGRLVIEHTTIEPFTGHIDENHRIRPYADALASRLGAYLPAGSRFQVTLDVGAVNGVRPTEVVLDAIATWVRAAAPALIDGRPGVDGAHMVRSGPPDVPIAMTLSRWPASPDSPKPALMVGRWVPPNLEEQRQDRLAAALKAKLPKLANAAAQGADRVLVIESADISLSNTGDIGAALRQAAGAFLEVLPEWIVLWEQHPPDATAVIWFLRADATWNDDPRPVTIAGVAPTS